MANKAVFCIAQSQQQATRFVEDARNAGFSDNDISVLLPDRGGSRDSLMNSTRRRPRVRRQERSQVAFLVQPPGIWSVSVRSPFRV